MHTEYILAAVVAALLVYIAYTKYFSGADSGAAEGFGACTDCDSYRDRIFTDADIVSQNPYRWPASGTAVTNQWMFSPAAVKPPNSTDDAEALAPPNPSGMNQLTVPDQEFETN